jgi:hypothetical protein
LKAHGLCGVEPSSARAHPSDIEFALGDLAHRSIDMCQIRSRTSDQPREVRKLQDDELDTVTGGEYACIRAEWITIDDEGHILPIFYPC